MGSIELVLEGFQSYRSEARFVFNTGINFIIGSNDSGKSAIFRAVACLLTNPMGMKDSYISKGEEGARISLGIDGVVASMWVSHKESTRYEYNGNFYDRVNRSSIVDLVGDYPIKLDEEGFPVGMMDEWSVMFPFGRKPAGMFRLFEDMFGIRDTSGIIKGFASRTLDLKKVLIDKNREKEVLLLRRESISKVVSRVDVSMLEEYRRVLVNSPVLISRMSGLLSKGGGLLESLPIVRDWDFGGVSRLARLGGCLSVLEKPVLVASIRDWDFGVVDRLLSLVGLLGRASGLLVDLPEVRTWDISLGRLEGMLAIYGVLRGKLEERTGIVDKLVELENSINSIKEELSLYKSCPVCGGGI